MNPLARKILFLPFLALVSLSCAPRKHSSTQRLAGKSVEILAVNDIHAAIDKFPRFGYMVDSLRQLYPSMLLLSAGDNQTGNPVNDQHKPKGLPVIELMNALRFDLSAVGNHEFDSSQKGFEYLTHRANFPFICSNVTCPDSLDLRIKPYHLLTLPNGVRAGFVSLLSINDGGIPDAHPDLCKGFSFYEPLSKLSESLVLRDSCDLFVFLNHYGVDKDRALAENLPKGSVDLIIGGHSHTLIDTIMRINDILITQAKSKLSHATLIKITFDEKGKVHTTMELFPIDKGAEKEDLLRMVERYNANPVLREVLAQAEDDMVSYDQLGYFMVDVLRATNGVQIGVLNPGGVRIESHPKGAFTVGDVYRLDPFGNESVIFTLTGAQIRDILFDSFRRDEFLPVYLSGIRSHYYLGDDMLPTRIDLFTEEGKPLDLSATYSVAMNSYMASVTNFDKSTKQETFRTTAESMIEFLRKEGKIRSYAKDKRYEIERR